MEVRWD